MLKSIQLKNLKVTLESITNYKYEGVAVYATPFLWDFMKTNNARYRLIVRIVSFVIIIVLFKLLGLI